MPKCERVLFWGIAISLLWNLVQIFCGYPNAVLVFTAILSSIAGIVGLLAELRSWKIADWWVIFYFIPMILIGAGAATNFYDILDWGLSLGKLAPLARPIPSADYGAEMLGHYISSLIVPIAWVAAVIARWRKWC